MHKNRNGKFFFVLLAFALIAIDQLSKYIIRSGSGFYICNQNFAFGLNLSNLLIIFFLLISAILAIKSFENSKSDLINLNIKYLKLFRISNLEFRIFDNNRLYLLLILSGAISNILDRLFFGCVIDFIDLKFWPVFNLADVYITIGSIAFIINIFTSDKK